MIERIASDKGWQNLEVWEEAKKEIAKIPEHPNKIPSERSSSAGTSAAGPSATRRDSTATINGR
jgi:sorting nexin-4